MALSGVESSLSLISAKVIGEIHKLFTWIGAPVVVAIDGGSGAGKSTLAALLEKELDMARVELDDFFAAGIPDSRWEQFSVAEKLEHVFEWERVRVVIEQLLAGKTARWQAFDFEGGVRADGGYGREGPVRERGPAAVILVEGAYAAGPALADLVDVTVLVDVPLVQRHARLREREDAAFLAAWHARWDELEAYYFGQVRPPESFDVVVEG